MLMKESQPLDLFSNLVTQESSHGRVKKQKTVAGSTVEAEYYSLYSATCEALWLKKLLTGIVNDDVTQTPTTIFQDNQGCIALAINGKHQGPSILSYRIDDC